MFCNSNASRRSVRPLLACAVLATTGCMGDPRNNMTLAATNTPITFDGYTRTPNQLAQLLTLKNSDQQWYSHVFAATSTSSVADPNGTLWYAYQVNNVVLP